jgi:hypothetical protein
MRHSSKRMQRSLETGGRDQIGMTTLGKRADIGLSGQLFTLSGPIYRTAILAARLLKFDF